jgi:hypothetical protein
MIRSFAFFAVIATLFAFPDTASAQLVPCENDCNTCDIITLLDNVFDWLVAILTIFFALIVVVSGLQMVTSVGNVSAKASAKKRVMNALVGLVLVLGAWVLVDLVLKTLLDGSFGPWNSVQCIEMKPTGP